MNLNYKKVEVKAGISLYYLVETESENEDGITRKTINIAFQIDKHKFTVTSIDYYKSSEENNDIKIDFSNGKDNQGNENDLVNGLFVKYYSKNVELVSNALKIYAVGIIGASFRDVLNKLFYKFKDNITIRYTSNINFRFFYSIINNLIKNMIMIIGKIMFI